MGAVKRMRYFDRQFLVDQDFTDEQDYHLKMRRRINKAVLNLPGVVQGLTVSGAVGSTAVTVAPGMAVDQQGQEIVLLEDAQQVNQQVNLPAGVSGPVRIFVSYSEAPTDTKSAGGTTGETRFTEAPVFTLVAPGETDPVDGLVLASLNMSNGQVAGSIDNTVRTMVTARVQGDLVARSVSLANDAVPSGQGPRMSCPGLGQMALERASLRIDGGKEILFSGQGQVRSLDDSHRIVFNRAASMLEFYETGDVRFLTPGATPVERVRILPNGSVAFGTSSPENAENWNKVVDIVGSTSTKVSVRTAQVDGRVQSSEAVAWQAPAGMMVGTKTNHPLSFGTFGAARMVLAANGNLGIGTTTPGARLTVTGDATISGPIVSPMWNVTRLLDQWQGSLPHSPPSFMSGGGWLLIFASGSGYATAGGTMIGMEIWVDNVLRGRARSFANEANSHKVFVANALYFWIPAGQHTLSLNPLAGTVTDVNDLFSVTALELPFPAPVKPSPIGTTPIALTPVT